MLTRLLATVAVIGGATAMTGTAAQGPGADRAPARPAARVIRAQKHDVSRPLREIPPVPPAPILKPTEREPESRHRGRGPRGVATDTVVQNVAGTSPAPAPSQNFEGVGNVNGVLPPDTNGDVGPSHYVQWVNLSFAIYAKGTPPALIYGPAAGSTLWAGFGGPCESTNNGDPIVLYDHLANRWVMSQLSLPNAFLGLLIGPFYQCIAVSATDDPTGAYYRYQFAFDKLNDYPKLSVWPDAYYMTTNQFTAITLEYAGQGVLAFDRASMLAGKTASVVYLDLASVDMNLGGMLPADLDGPPPPAGSPGYFAQVDDDAWGYSGDQLQLWRFHVDWTQPSASTFTRAAAMPTEPFDSDLCAYSRNCLPQPGTTVKVDAIADRLMYRLQYRNFGDHESLVVNHTVDVDGNDHAGIRWYEVRDLRTSPVIYQQGTYAPDADNRWMGSVAVDSAGNLALGFSVSGPNTSPSIRYAGRLATDPPGVLTQSETSLIDGAGAQTDSSGRWGDYSMMTVDPSDDCTFWYTQEYYTARSAIGWHTRIGAFSFPSCQPSTKPRVTVAATTTPASEAGPVPGAFTFTRTGDTSQAMAVQYSIAGSATPDVDYVALPASIVIPADAASATVQVMPIDDSLYEDDETVSVTVAYDAAYSVGSPASAVVTITSDDLPPDLVVTGVSAPAASGPGATMSVSDTTKNQGTGPAGASVTAFYLSRDTRFDSGDTPIATRPVPLLAAGAASTTSTPVQIPASTAVGTYYVIARADDSDVVTENVETNNVAVSAAVRIGADLVVSALSGPTTAGVGDTISVSVTTANQGGGAAEATTTRFYLSPNGTINASTPVLGSRAVPALGPGASDSAPVSLTISPSTTPGRYYVVAKADADAVVAEIQEANNQRNGPLMKVGPDLTASVSTAAIAGAGGTLTVTDTTSNIGGGTAAGSSTSFYLSINLSLDASDQLLGARPVPSLAQGASSTATTSLLIPADTATGTYYVLAKADSGDGVAESLETNNVGYSAAVRIGPDLAISSLTGPPTAGAGTTILVTDTTKNVGGGVSPASTTTLYLSSNVSLDASDVVLGQRPVPQLAVGATSSASTSLQIPADTVTGTWYVFAKADGPGTVTESNEANNVSSGLVVRVGPDLAESGVTASISGTSITVNDTTTNKGGGSAPASTTNLYLSPNLALDTGDVLIGGHAVPPLATGLSSAASTVVSLPAGTAAGVYYVLAKADGPDSVVETIESNNVSSTVSIRVGPDLTVTVTAPAIGGPGAMIGVGDTTTNQGNADASASTTSYYLSSNTGLDSGDVLLGSRPVALLNAGTSSAGAAAVQIPVGTATGTYYVIAKADGLGTVAESNETNNASSGKLIRIGPDLAVSVLTVPSTGTAGATIAVTDTTTDQGGGSAPSSNTRFYLSTNVTLDASDVLLGSRTVAALDPAGSDNASTLLTIPPGTVAAGYYVIAVADGDATVPETIETNNARASFLRISN